VWKKVLREYEGSVPSLKYYAYRDIPETEILPWAHISTEDKMPILSRQMAEALTEAKL
jgi:hypothetical protein